MRAFCVDLSLSVRAARSPKIFLHCRPFLRGDTPIDFLKLEYEFLWKKSWLYVCHADQLAAPGDYMLWNETRSPVIIVRGQDSAIHAFYNTCRHRGAPLVKLRPARCKGALPAPTMAGPMPSMAAWSVFVTGVTFRAWISIALASCR